MCESIYVSVHVCVCLSLSLSSELDLVLFLCRDAFIISVYKECQYSV